MEALVIQARQVEHDHRMSRAFIPEGYRIEVPYMSSPEPMWSMESYAVQSSVQIRTARIVFSHLNGWTLEE